MLLDHLTMERILPDGTARTKQGVLSDIARLLSGGDPRLGALILSGLLERESVMSTGIGHGIALPHARLDAIDDMRLALARYRRGVDFAALDEKPVYLAFGVIGPLAAADQHVKTLARIARLVKDPSAVEQLRAAPDAAACLEVLRSRPT